MDKGILGRIILSAAIAAITFAVFSESFGYGLVNLDDAGYRFAHPEVTGGLSWASIRWAFSNVEDSIWMPLTWLSYMADVSFFGGTFRVLHVHGVIVHALNAALLFFLLSHFIGNCRRGLFFAALAALVWALHPLRCESVVWVASRKDVLCQLWELLALVFWVRFGRAGKDRVRLYAASMACLVMASFAKPSCMTFPVLAFVIDLLILAERPKLRWRVYVIPLAYAAVIGAVAQHAQRAGGATAAYAEVPFAYRLLNACSAYGLYIWHTVCPFDLAVQCTLRYPQAPRFLHQGAAIVAGAGLFILWRIRRRWASLKALVPVRERLLGCVLFFTVAVAPFLGLSNFGYHAFADRFTYLPSLAFSLLLVVAADIPNAHLRNGLACGVTLVVALLGAQTVRQTRYWRNEAVLYTHTLEVDGGRNTFALSSLYNYYFEVKHDLDMAIACYEKERAVKGEGFSDMGSLYLMSLYEKGELEKLNAEYRRYMEDESRNIAKAMKGDVRAGGSTQLYLAAVIYALATGDFSTASSHLEYLGATGQMPSMVFYLRGLLALMQEDESLCRDNWLRIFAIPENDLSYIQFRWLYHDAVREGWASPPINDFQRAIWNRVKAEKAAATNAPAATPPAK